MVVNPAVLLFSRPLPAHADFAQTARFVEALKPPTIVLVHGEKNEMRRLYQARYLLRRAGTGADVCSLTL